MPSRLVDYGFLDARCLQVHDFTVHGRNESVQLDKAAAAAEYFTGLLYELRWPIRKAIDDAQADGLFQCPMSRSLATVPADAGDVRALTKPRCQGSAAAGYMHGAADLWEFTVTAAR